MHGSLRITGSLGDVMKESVAIAHTMAKNFLSTYLPNSAAANYLESQDLHIHVPEGAVHKVFFLKLNFLGWTKCWRSHNNRFYKFSFRRIRSSKCCNDR